MLLQLFIPLAFALQIVLGGAAAMAQPSRPAAPVGPSSAETDRSAADMARLQRRRVQKLAEKQVLERTYEAQLRELDRLKRSKASWRRDREIRSSQAESQTTAQRLSSTDLELRTIDGLLRRQRQTLLAAIDRELALRPSATRRAVLDRMRGQITAALKPRVRKILVPDDTLDELADPEELAEQVALIEQAESELRREGQSLQQREDRYARMARLRDLRERASQMSELEEESVRRTGGRGNGRTGAATDSQGDAEDDGEAPPPPAPPPLGTGSTGGDGGASDGATTGSGGAGEDSGFEQSSILLTDVVDSSTLDALRRAGRSPSPRARAEAAARARKQVEARLQRLERGRALIQRHLTRLRQGQ